MNSAPNSPIDLKTLDAVVMHHLLTYANASLPGDARRFVENNAYGATCVADASVTRSIDNTDAERIWSNAFCVAFNLALAVVAITSASPLSPNVAAIADEIEKARRNYLGIVKDRTAEAA